MLINVVVVFRDRGGAHDMGLEVVLRAFQVSINLALLKKHRAVSRCIGGCQILCLSVMKWHVWIDLNFYSALRVRSLERGPNKRVSLCWENLIYVVQLYDTQIIDHGSLGLLLLIANIMLRTFLIIISHFEHGRQRWQQVISYWIILGGLLLVSIFQRCHFLVPTGVLHVLRILRTGVCVC
jgi:hypothetical protein